MLRELAFEPRIGDAAKIRATQVRRQKTDRRDAEQNDDPDCKNSVGYGRWTHIDGLSKSVVEYIRTLELAAQTNVEAWILVPPLYFLTQLHCWRVEMERWYTSMRRLPFPASPAVRSCIFPLPLRPQPQFES
ncbi:MAG: hypothetical protein ACRD3B_00460 [Candidatus Sulfotelmatobacter sp.]